MTPNHKEDNITAAIVAALDRNTAAIQSYRDWTFAVMMVLVLFLGILLTALSAKATPIAPPIPYDLGQPPSPLPNPNLQYWYTADIPGPQGVLPQEIYAPRLAANMASAPQAVETPEPGTGWLVGGFLALLACFAVANHVANKSLREWGREAKQATRYRLALLMISETTTADAEVLKKIAAKALEEEKDPK